KIDLSKPWDDPANAEAYNTRVPIYCCPSANCPQDHTTYLAVVASNSCFPPGETRSLAQIRDNRGETLMVIEVTAPATVHWMSPEDVGEESLLSLAAEAKVNHHGGTHGAMADGTVLFLSTKTSAAQMRALISIAGSDKFE